MTRQTNELDRLIDTLNAGDTPALDADADPELAGLLNAVTRIRRLREVDEPEAESPEDGWPGRVVRDLARELRQSAAPDVEGASSQAGDENPSRGENRQGPARLSTEQARDNVTHRRRIPRELMQIAAAIAVLVLVGGVLAVVFRGQGGGNEGGVGAGPTPTSTTASQLPQMVTSSGLRITLSSAKLDGSQVVLTFKIESADPNQPNMWVVGGGGELMGIPLEANDIVTSGLRYSNQIPVPAMSPLAPPGAKPPPRAPSPTPQPTPDVTGYLDSLGFVLTGSADQPVTVTIQRVRFNNAPSSPPPGKVISGTWSFTFVPARLGAPPLPTPHQDGNYYDLSVSQAEQLVGFPIALPNPLPNVLQPLPDAAFIASAVGSTGSAKANYVTFFYSAADMIDKGVTVVETTADSAVPTIQQNTIHWNDRGHETTIPVSKVATSTVTVKGVTVTKWDTTQQSAHVIYYLWNEGDVHIVVSTIPGQQVTQAVMGQFVGAMIAPSSATLQPSPTPTLPFALPTPDKNGQIILTFAQTQQLANFYVAKPTWVPSYLQDQGIMVPQWQGNEPPGSPFERIILTYDSSDPSQHYMVQISESGVGIHSSFGSQASTPTTLSIAGHQVTQTDVTAGSGAQINQVKDFLWKDQGTTFELTSELSGPVTERDLEHMIASMLAQGTAQATPTGAGSNSNLTVAQARDLTAFQIIEPKTLPTPFVSTPASVTAYRVGIPGSSKANYVELRYSSRSPSLQEGLYLVETTDKNAVPTITDQTASVVLPLSPNGTLHTMSVVRGTEVLMGIQGVVVTKFDVADSNSPLTYFVWTYRGVSSFIWVARTSQGTGLGVDESELQQMVGGIINQQRGPGLASSSGMTDILAVLRGIVLALILVAVYRLRRIMLCAWAIFVIVALFTAFLFIDGIVSGPWMADVGLVVGGALVLGAVALLGQLRQSRNHVTR